MGKTKDYKKIIAQLDNLQEHTRSMERDGEEIGSRTAKPCRRQWTSSVTMKRSLQALIG